MTPAPTPSDDRDSEYLASACAWLRALLMRHAPATEPADAGQSHQRWRRSEVDRQAVPLAGLDELNQRRLDLESVDPPPSHVSAAREFGLSRFEQDLFLLCVAVELDPEVALLCSRVLRDPSLPFATFALAEKLFPEPTMSALSPERPLRYWRLLEFEECGRPFVSRPLRADERMIHHSKGTRHLDTRLLAIAQPARDSASPQLPSSQQETADEVARLLANVSNASAGHLPVVNLIGSPRSALAVALEAANASGLEAVITPANRLEESDIDLVDFARLWNREFRLGPTSLVLTGLDELGDVGQRSVLTVLDDLTGPTFVVGTRLSSGSALWTYPIVVAHPTAREQANIWEQIAGIEPDEAETMAAQFDLDAFQIEETVRTLGVDEEDRAIAAWNECRRQSRDDLEPLARRIETKARIDDLVLPTRELGILHMLASQAQSRIRVYEDWGFEEHTNGEHGIAALFVGASGTGKATAAEALANQLEVDLHRLDLAELLRPSVAHSESHVTTVFDAAEANGGVLLFDGAEAIFGRATGIERRLANYLFRKLDAYAGVSVLTATTHESIDPAFMNRFRFVVGFPLPGPEERRRLWEKALPEAAPVDPSDPSDLEQLAAFDLSGGAIHAATVTAAFLAAADDRSIGMRHHVAGARNERLKLESLQTGPA